MDREPVEIVNSLREEYKFSLRVVY